MKRHYLYRWFRNTVLVGLPIIFTTCSKYGMPEQEMRISGTIVDKETQQPIPNVQVNCAGDFPVAYSDSLGKFDCKGQGYNFIDVHFVKEHYQTLDTVLEGNVITGVFEMKKE